MLTPDAAADPALELRPPAPLPPDQVLAALEDVAATGSYEAELPALRFRFSDGLFRLIGEAPQAFVPTLDLIDARSHPDDAAAVRRVLAQAIAGQQPYYYRRRIRRGTDGQWRTLEVHGRVMGAEPGRPARLLGLVQDVTEREQAAAELARSQATIERMLHGAVAAIGIFEAVRDEAGRLTDFCYCAGNPAAEQLLGRAGAELRGQGLFGLWPEARAALFEGFGQAVATGQPYRTQYHRPLAGADYWFDVAAVRNGDGLILTLHDVTAQRQAEQQVLRLQAEEAAQATDLYRTLFNSMDEGFCVLQILFDEQQRPVDYRFLDTNAVFEQQTGLHDVLGRTARELVPTLEPFWFETYGRVVLTGEPVRFVDHAGAMGRWFDVNAFRVGRPEERKVAVLFNDITARKQAEAALRTSENQQAFLLLLSDRLRPLASATDIQYQAARALGEYLGASRVGYAEVQPDGQTVVVTSSYLQNVPALHGRYHLDDYGARLLPELRAGRTVVRPDVLHDPTLTPAEQAAHAALQLGATVNVPLVKDGQLAAIVFMHHAAARAWTADELVLLEETAERTWAAVERARAEEASRQAEEKFRTLFNSIDEGFNIIELIYDEQDRPVDYLILEGNPAHERLTGLGNLVGKRISEVNPALEPRWLERFGHAARTGEPVRFEDYAAGLGRWFSIHAARLGGAGSRQVALVFDEITERKQAEEALRQSEERFRAIVTQATVGIVETVAGGRIVYVNDRYCEITGYAREQILGTRAADISHPDEAARNAGLVERLYASGEPFVLDKRYVRPDGSVVWVLNSVTPIRNAAGQISGSFAACIDVTDRKQAEQALRRSEERLLKAMSIQTVGVTFFDFEGVIHDANAAFQHMSGYAHADFLSGRVRREELTAPEFLTASRRARQELLARGENTPYEKQCIRPDGSRWWGLFSGKRLNEQECVEFVLDITPGKEAEQQLHAFNEQLRRTNVDLDNFIYTASHDLKAPIANIEGLIDALRAQLPAAVQQAHQVTPLLEMMQDAVERFRRTIEHLSDIVKLQKEHDQPVTDVLLRPVIDDVLLDLQPLVAQAGAAVSVAVEEGQSVSFSVKNLRSVVYNLLSNALKYRHPERPLRVQVRCRPAADYIVLEVEDNGLGVEPGRQGELFQMFRRLHDHVEGTGIGLYMVKRSVENMGGRVEVRSQRNQGSTFAVYFKR